MDIPHSDFLFCKRTLGLFLPSAIVNNAARRMGIQISVLVSAFDCLGYRPRSGSAGSHGNSMFNFIEEPPWCLPQKLYGFTFLPATHEVFNFPTSSPTHILFCFFLLKPSKWM